MPTVMTVDNPDMGDVILPATINLTGDATADFPDMPLPDMTVDWHLDVMVSTGSPCPVSVTVSLLQDQSQTQDGLTTITSQSFLIMGSATCTLNISPPISNGSCLVVVIFRD